MTLRTNKCKCRCHTDNNYKHIAACCCMHRIKRLANCPECSARKQLQAMDFYNKVKEALDE